VVGEGPSSAVVMLVGEQPGDVEDQRGRPFVGPAGRLLDRALDAAGGSRDEVYVTNAVKHFRHEQRGKKRIHRKPNLAHLRACAPWIHREIEIVRPSILGLMGSTASRAILGVDVRVMEERGQVRPTPLGPRAVITIHPSAVLRLRDSAERESAFQGFVTDLRTTFAESRRMPA
jgi:uracil-DNA glycosylase